ncbi:putative G3BP-like protein, partial [Dipodascopsis tothii]|uniref:putative G3BP-like protein n=1 Tax=Dipodascopsis tothii TaxID=44089 RepID=UPI0034CD1BA2
IGWMFVQEYYAYLNKNPRQIYRFYTKKSILCHGTEGEDATTSNGQQQINEKILQLDFQDCKVLISNVDCQPSINGGILIQVLGEMSNNGGPSRKFTESFFLAEQESGGYYVLNDIFRYLNEDIESDTDD